MNKVIMIGNLVKDPEIKMATNSATGAPLRIASFSIAVNDRKGKDGAQLVQYFNCSSFDKTAEVLEKYVKKGHKICIQGQLKNRSWDKPDGTKGYATDILVTDLEMLTTKADADRLSMETVNDSAPVQATPVQKQSRTKMIAEPTEDVKLPVINVDELNIQMPF
jgi:single-strand DNA-binding protein